MPVQFQASEDSASLDDRDSLTPDSVDNAIQAPVEPEADGFNTDENSSEGIDQIHDDMPHDAESSSQRGDGNGWQMVGNNDSASTTEAQDDSFPSSSKDWMTAVPKSFLSPSMLIQDELDTLESIHVQNQLPEWTNVIGTTSCQVEAANTSIKATLARPSPGRGTAEGRGQMVALAIDLGLFLF
ncbi:uncharacterized protein HRG_11288 [Hirsutella rhossiliensis]|uniref:Uncharacterized protein n=1 Tax=Hirsutella rhossiliensis TaxID=111463 RepID=A0A9P8MM13_9HYPO|nr:uncharacterized protein HRG_11288 [Hirsutella rhossiliensis]KAH0957797.1 hypothetical protein HRG_11288 [Hirsutella rhossiliensis]